MSEWCRVIGKNNINGEVVPTYVPNRDNTIEKKNDLCVLVLVFGTESLRGWPRM